MNKPFQVLLFSIFLILSIFVGFYVGNNFNNMNTQSIDASHHQFHMMLGLTDEQLILLKPIEKEFAQNKKYYENKIRNANMELGDIMKTEKALTPAVEEAVQKIHNAMGELQKITLTHLFDMRSILNEEQVQSFDDYVADVMYGL